MIKVTLVELLRLFRIILPLLPNSRFLSWESCRPLAFAFRKPHKLKNIEVKRENSAFTNTGNIFLRISLILSFKNNTWGEKKEHPEFLLEVHFLLIVTTFQGICILFSYCKVKWSRPHFSFTIDWRHIC